MTRLRIAFCLVALGLVAAAPAPSLKLMSGGFEPGLWQITPLDEDSRMRMPQGAMQCLVDPTMLLHAGQDSPGTSCGHTVVEDSADRATVTYVCKGQGYGRTSIRRSGASGFTVNAQGIAGREPFEMRGEYKRIGACPAGGR